MKTRDKVKYAFATFLALMTCVAIAAMVVAKLRRENVPPDERERIRHTLRTFGQPSATPGTNAAPTTTPAPSGAREIPPPVAAQHGATQGDPASRP